MRSISDWVRQFGRGGGLLLGLLSSTAALAQCPPDCGALGIGIGWRFGNTVEVTAGYNSRALVPLNYNDVDLGTATFAYEALLVQPISLRHLVNFDVTGTFKPAYLYAEISEDYTSPQMANSRFHVGASQYFSVGLWDTLTGNPDPDYGVTFSVDATTQLGLLDVTFPALRVDFDNSRGYTSSWGILPRLELFGDSTPGACGELLGESCYTFDRGWFKLTPFVGGPELPEPSTWAMMIAGFGLTGGVLRRRRSAVVQPACGPEEARQQQPRRA